MRRAMRHADLRGCREPMIYRLVPALVRQMGEAFPELVRAQPLVTETLKLEETRFKDTLGRGLRLLEEETGRLGAKAPLPGEVAFRLYDTYGDRKSTRLNSITNAHLVCRLLLEN